MLNLKNLKHQNSNNFFLIAGPCAIEGEEMAFDIADKLVNMCDKLEVPLIFKGSYRKANRSRLDSFTGIGDEKALSILKSIGTKFDVPTITDIHESHEAAKAAEYVDALQIPAFLCRQTALLVAAANTGKYVNVKKGQFLSGDSMKHAVTKIRESGNNNIILTERGNSFGYGEMIVDFRNLPEMKSNKVPVVMDITHSLQKTNQKSGVTGGQPDMIETIGKAAIAVGADGLFIETHPDPSVAKSDGANMLKLNLLEDLLVKLIKVRKSVI